MPGAASLDMMEAEEGTYMNLIKRMLLPFLLIVFLAGCGGSGKVPETAPAPSLAPGDNTGNTENIESSPLWTDKESARFMVISDLHYTGGGALGTSDVSGMSFSEEITDAILQEVTDRRPDALIMTGDNTNGGSRKDAESLAEELKKVRSAGVQIIMTTGNHDFDGMSPREFEEIYFGLLEPMDRDSCSLSYTAAVKDIVFLAMDDGALHPGGTGEFSEETMDWISSMLDKYRDKKVIFLCHHSVLYGSREGRGAANMVQNEDLPDLLRRGGVRLALTGHMHYQNISEEGGLWEIISAMPFSGRHLTGHLAAGPRGVVYKAVPADIASYAPALSEKLGETERAGEASRRGVFARILEKEKVKRPESDRVLDLILRFFGYFEEGTLSEHAPEILSDPAYPKMIEVLWDYNYGPWMKAAVEEAEHSSVSLELTW